MSDALAAHWRAVAEAALQVARTLRQDQDPVLVSEIALHLDALLRDSRPLRTYEMNRSGDLIVTRDGDNFAVAVVVAGAPSRLVPGVTS